jgi:hypothetical protein
VEVNPAGAVHDHLRGNDFDIAVKPSVNPDHSVCGPQVTEPRSVVGASATGQQNPLFSKGEGFSLMASIAAVVDKGAGHNELLSTCVFV